MKVYRGKQAEVGFDVTVSDESGERPLPIRHDLRRHSEAFNISYAGSGPAQLALALCADVLQDDEQACAVYQRYKFAVIARLKGGSFELTEEQIHQTIFEIEQE